MIVFLVYSMIAGIDIYNTTTSDTCFIIYKIIGFSKIKVLIDSEAGPKPGIFNRGLSIYILLFIKPVGETGKN
jgi:hypothetical protein